MTAERDAAAVPAAPAAPLLSVRDLRTFFRTDDGVVLAVDGVSFDLARGETLGIVGESGCGKSVTALSVMGLVPAPGVVEARAIELAGEDLAHASEKRLRDLRGDRVTMIFQDPMTSLNPFLTVERQLTEVLERHRGLSRRQARARAIEMLERVGIADAAERIRAYPHQFSGGMRQRVMIAMALLCEPELLIADEPTTALDVTIQAQILDLVRDLVRDSGTSVILITHDLGVVAGMADRVLVMYAGRMVEEGTTEALFEAPLHPYTEGLLKSVPRLDVGDRADLVPISGLPPHPSNLPPGCPFHPRCPRVMERCRSDYPAVVTVEEGRWAACWDVVPIAETVVEP
ncbi:MAG TPA: ABC transporter ATP-binding protein [Thermoanaerobaculia bacterium]|nr:ABC transporter ATP-binding protein [Thermoanaerobaculia bacterium]